MDDIEAASIIKAGDPGQIARLVREIPATTMDGVAHPQLKSDSLFGRLLAADILSTQLGYSGDGQAALWLSTAALAVVTSARDDPAFPPGSAAKLVASLALTRANALMLAGRQAEVPGQEEIVRPLLDPVNDRTGCDMLLLKTVEALIDCNQLEESDRRLTALEQAGCEQPSLPALRVRLRLRLQKVTELTNPDALTWIKDEALTKIVEMLLTSARHGKP